MNHSSMPNVRNNFVPTTQTIRCCVYEGFCNRINCLVSAILTNRPVQLFWGVNQHCPVRFEELFEPIENVAVTNLPVEYFPYRISEQFLCWFYVANVLDLPREEFTRRAKASYRLVLSKLRHRSTVTLPYRTAGISYRHFFSKGSADGIDSFLRKTYRWLKSNSPDHVFVAADSSDAKRCIVKFVDRLKIKYSVIECPLLTSDLDRSKENLVGLSKELLCFTRCNLGIISNSMRSSVTDSSRGFNVSVHKTFDSKLDRRNYTLESWLNENS